MIDLTLKSDQEAVMIALLQDISRARAKKGAMRTVIEHSPIYGSKSNGVVERAVKSVEGQIRVMKSALQDRLAVIIGIHHPILTWLVEYASFLINRCDIGRDGQTAYERCKKKSVTVRGFEFGESILWKRQKKPKRAHRYAVPCVQRCLLHPLLLHVVRPLPGGRCGIAVQKARRSQHHLRTRLLVRMLRNEGSSR